MPIRSGPLDWASKWSPDKLSDRAWARLTSACVGLLGTPDWGTANWAVISIAWGLPDPAAALPRITERFREPNLRARLDAANVLLLMGVRDMTKPLEAGQERRRLVESLIALLEIAPTDPLLAPYPNAAALQRGGMSGAPPSLARPVDARSVARGVAAAALGGFCDDPTVIEALRRASGDQDPRVSYFATESLRRSPFIELP